MAIAYDEFDSRVDAMVTAFENARATTLARQLPKAVTVHKGPHRWNTPGAGDFAVFIARAGHPDIKYDMGQQTAEVTMSLGVVAATYSVAGDDADMEGYVNIFGANVAALLFSLVKNTGTGSWHSGIWRRSVSISDRDEDQQTVEKEVFQFDVTFEVNYAA